MSVSRPCSTPRDAIDTSFEWEGHKLLLIDTAGIRRSGKIQGTVEYYSVLRAQRAIERADVAVTVIDSIDGLKDGDKRVAGMALERPAVEGEAERPVAIDAAAAVEPAAPAHVDCPGAGSPGL